MSDSPRTCSVCGGPLGYRKKRLCSPECTAKDDAARERAKRRRNWTPDVECRECRSVVAYGGVGRPPAFCSPACRLRFNSRKRRRRLVGVSLGLALRACGHCGREFRPDRQNGVYCSVRCYSRGNKRRPPFQSELRACENCGDQYVTIRADQRFCSIPCQRRAHARRRARSSVRSPLGIGYSDIDVFERDGWRCHLCGQFVSKDISRTDPMGATVDHLVPLSLGGDDDAANVALAHRRCNGLRGVRPLT